MLASLHDLPRSHSPCSVPLSLAHSAQLHGAPAAPPPGRATQAQLPDLHTPGSGSNTRYSGASLAICLNDHCPVPSEHAPSYLFVHHLVPHLQRRLTGGRTSSRSWQQLSSLAKAGFRKRRGRLSGVLRAVQLPCCLWWGVRVRPGRDGLFRCPASHSLPALYPFFLQKGGTKSSETADAAYGCGPIRSCSQNSKTLSHQVKLLARLLIRGKAVMSRVLNYVKKKVFNMVFQCLPTGAPGWLRQWNA